MVEIQQINLINFGLSLAELDPLVEFGLLTRTTKGSRRDLPC